MRIRTHPGEVLREEFGVTIFHAAALDMRPATLRAILNERHPVTPAIAEKLARHCRTTPQFWLNLQHAHEASRRQA